MYRLLRNLLFLFPPELVHQWVMAFLRIACRIPGLRPLLRSAFCKKAPELERTAMGLHFPNFVGLGAGFDKNGKYLEALQTLGFGFVEVGTVTPLAQQGNDRPRLFRLKKDQALINRMGFNNEGAQRVALRLKKWRLREARTGKQGGMILGGNIGKNKHTPNEEAWKDYEKGFEALFPYVDYFVVNVSSPNTPGLRALQEKDALRNILTRLQALNRSLAAGQHIPARPLCLKIAPDLSDTQLFEIVDLALEIRLDGLVISNTTTGRSGLLTPQAMVTQMGAGGLSGKPLQALSTEVLEKAARRAQGKLFFLGSGGVFSGADAREKFQAGAHLVQVWTGFIYEGPAIVKKILQSFLR